MQRGRHHLALGVPLEQRPVVLGGDERRTAGRHRGVGGVGDLPAGEVGVAEVADLALGDEVVEGGQGLVDRGDRVRGVQLVQVDVVGLQPGEGLLHRDLDVIAAALRARRRAVAHVGVPVAELGGEHDLVPAALQDLSQGEFGRARAAVGLGGVEERDALVDGGVDDRPGLLDVETAAEVVAAEAYYRDEQAGVTQGSVAHGSASYARRPAASLSGNDTIHGNHFHAIACALRHR